VKRKLDEGMTFRQLSEENFGSFCRYEKGFRSYKRLHTAKRNWPMEIVLFIGPSGTGKTRAAAELAGTDALWVDNGKWFDGYDGQHTVIFDEFYGSKMPFSALLRLLDRYPYSVEYKGGVIEFVSRRVIFTSNEEPENWYSAEKTHQMDWEHNPLNRRIREFGRIVRSGQVHQAVAAAAPLQELVEVLLQDYDDIQPMQHAPIEWFSQ